jgi:hypothetical protein
MTTEAVDQWKLRYGNYSRSTVARIARDIMRAVDWRHM